MKPIVAVIVLYRMSIAESPACRAMLHALDASPRFAQAIHLIVADNSPEPQSMPPHFPGDYLHDKENPGLARRYNQALDLAVSQQAEWLLLFDQDTHPTPEYLEEILTLSSAPPNSRKNEGQNGGQTNQQIDIIVPKLRMDGLILSPHAPRFGRARRPVTLGTQGVGPTGLRAFNSAALVRISALQAIGGFPTTYWLDYLDHATFHRIQENGGRLFVMRSVLEHDLAEARANAPQNPARLVNRLQAEERFYTEHASPLERFQHRLDLLRQIVGWGRRGHLQQARLRLKVLLHVS